MQARMILLMVVVVVLARLTVSSAFAVTLRSNRTTAVFSDSNGALVSFKTGDGVERICPSAELFTLQFLDADGNTVDFKSSDFKFAFEDDAFVYRRSEGPEVHIRVTGENGRLLFRPSVTKWPKGLRLNWIDAPQVTVANDGALYWPFYDGCEVIDFANREAPGNWLNYRPMSWVPHCKAWGSLYPGSCQMQFLAYYRGGKGIYFAALDDGIWHVAESEK